jgi:hypothetical protein
MGGKSGKTVQPSEAERRAINEREQMELARELQFNADQERRLNMFQRGGRKILLYKDVLGTKGGQQQQQQTATMGVRS